MAPKVLSTAGAAALQLPLLVWVERRAAHPILPVWVFAGRARVLLLVALTAAAANYGAVFLLVPLFMQDALGMRPSEIGRLLSARPLAATAASLCMSRLLADPERRRLPLMRLGGGTLLV